MGYTMHVPTKLYFGEGTMKHLESELKGIKKVLLTYGGGSIKANGLYDEVMNQLKQLNIEVIELSGISPNPRITEVMQGIELVRKHNVDLILAVGGGSVVDCSKAIAVGAYYEGDAWNLVKGNDHHVITKAVPLGVILTLSATGSESNAGAVITNLETKEKLGFGVAPHSFPKFSILDPKNTLTVPKDHTIYGVVDIIAHLFEQYFTPRKDDEHIVDITLTYIEKLLKTIMSVGLELVNDLNNIQLREAMLHIGTEALNTRIGALIGGDWSSHSIEHSLSAYYDIPHGAGLAIVYPHWMKMVAKKRTDRLYRMAIHVFDVETDHYSEAEIIQIGIDRFTTFLEKLGAPTKLSQVGITKEFYNEMAKHSLWNDTVGSYAKLNTEELIQLFESAE